MRKARRDTKLCFYHGITKTPGIYATLPSIKYNFIFWQKLRKVFRIKLQVVQNFKRTEPKNVGLKINNMSTKTNFPVNSS